MTSKNESASKILLLLLCAYLSFIIVHAGDGQRYKVLATGSPKPEGVCSSEPLATPSSSTQFTVPLNHRYGPCSRLSSAKKQPTFVELLDNDKLRADYIRRKFSKESGAGGAQELAVTVPTILGSSLDTLQYVITVGIGSPVVKQTMFIDTGSDVSWVHCHSGSPFNPSKSTTYAPFSCSSAECASLRLNACSNSKCQYTVRYGGGSNTTGTYGSDTLALDKSVVVKNFQFGCSIVSVDQGGIGKTDGLMGLGGDTESLVSQTAATYGKAFSYCLPPSSDTSGFLTLGASSNGSGFMTTPMLRSKQAPTFYIVLMQGIAVGGKLLNIPISVFSGGNGTILMDSGTVITRLPPTAYSALKSAFKDGMKQYPLAKATGSLDTCFDFTGYTNITLPSVALVFSGGAVVDLPGDGIMLGNCLAFAAMSDIGIIGNVQQRTFEVLHDVGNSVVGFRPSAC